MKNAGHGDDQHDTVYAEEHLQIRQHINSAQDASLLQSFAYGCNKKNPLAG